MRASEEDTRVLLPSVCALLCAPYFPCAWFAVYSWHLPIDKKLSTPPYCQSCPVLPTFSVGMVTVSKISCPSLHFLFLLPLVTRWWTTLTSYSMYVFIYFLCCFRCPKCNSGQMLNHLCTLILNHSNPPRKRRKKRYEGPVCEEKFFPLTNLASEWFGDHASETMAW